MKSVSRSSWLIGLGLLIVLLYAVPILAADPVRTIEASDVAENNTIVGVRGSFAEPEVDKILTRLNQIRLEACQKGYPDPNNPQRKLTAADYSPISWSGDMEVIAQMRAVEATLLQSHTRPNGQQPFTVISNGMSSDSETLAWNYDGMMKGIEQWYGEKDDWVKQNTDEVTGHYTAIINPYAHRIGLGGFVPDDGGWQTVAGEFAFEPEMSSAQLGMYGRVLAQVEVYRGALGTAKIAGPKTMIVGTAQQYDAVMRLSYGNRNLSRNVRQVVKIDDAEWKSSEPDMLSVDNLGSAQARSKGSATLSVSFADGTQASFSVKVKWPGAGDKLTRDSMVYQIMKGGRSVRLVQCLRSGRITIPANVKLGGRKYKIEEIGKNAFRRNLGVTSVSIGKNVHTIEKRAFYGCKTLREIRFKTKKLRRIVGKAFAQTGIVRVSAPKSVRSRYKALLSKKGLSAKVKFK